MSTRNPPSPATPTTVPASGRAKPMTKTVKRFLKKPKYQCSKDYLRFKENLKRKYGNG